MQRFSCLLCGACPWQGSRRRHGSRELKRALQGPEPGGSAGGDSFCRKKRGAWQAIPGRTGEALSTWMRRDDASEPELNSPTGALVQETKLRMAQNRALTLIVARPGPLRDGVEALLASVPRVNVIAKVELVSRALSIATERPLDLLLLDAGLPGCDAGRLLRSCRRRRPGLRCIALADDAEQEQAAKASGADAVFLKGFPADRFAETVERLLSESGST